jgi:peptidoglycan/LPS O-acetylase OafA/YrhL
MKYRADIDGLRAIAVLAVLAAHTGVQVMQGGFFGVDVFFVISGYLISGIVFAEVQAGTFSLATFYQRRVRRIVPALVVVLVAILPLAYFYVLPVEMRDFSWSLVTTALGVSNIYFWSQSGYFDAPSAEKPLLHTWSLSVEEQFYVIFPTLLVILHRICRPQLKIAVAALCVVSFISNCLGSVYYPAGACCKIAPARSALF